MAYLDGNGLAHVWARLKPLFEGKVDTREGFDLSSNDYTAAEKTKLAAFGAATTYALKTDLAGVAAVAMTNSEIDAAFSG